MAIPGIIGVVLLEFEFGVLVRMLGSGGCVDDPGLDNDRTPPPTLNRLDVDPLSLLIDGGRSSVIPLMEGGRCSLDNDVGRWPSFDDPTEPGLGGFCLSAADLPALCGRSGRCNDPPLRLYDRSDPDRL